MSKGVCRDFAFELVIISTPPAPAAVLVSVMIFFGLPL